MTTDVVINNIINELCQKFNVAASELVPRLQAYGMAMSLYGAVTAAAFCIVIFISAVIIIKKFCKYDIPFVIFLATMIEIIPLIMLLFNIYMYIGWKYAPEIKTIEYVTNLIH